MTASEFETLRSELSALRTEFSALRIDVIRLEAKIDNKPSTAALYQAVVTMMFGIGVTITSTVVVLKNLGLIGVVPS